MNDKQRLEIVKTLLSDTNWTGRQMMSRVDISNNGPLRQLVKEGTGLTPTTYRKQYQRNPLPALAPYTREVVLELPACEDWRAQHTPGLVINIFDLEHPGDVIRAIKLRCFTLRDEQGNVVIDHHPTTPEWATWDTELLRIPTLYEKEFTYANQEAAIRVAYNRHSDTFVAAFVVFDQPEPAQGFTARLDLEVRFNDPHLN